MRKLAVSLVLATVFTFGLSSFTTIYGCGGSQGGSGCREVAPIVKTDLLSTLDLVARVFGALLP